MEGGLCSADHSDLHACPIHVHTPNCKGRHPYLVLNHDPFLAWNISPHLTSPQFTSPHLPSTHLTSTYLLSPPLPSPPLTGNGMHKRAVPTHGQGGSMFWATLRVQGRCTVCSRLFTVCKILCDAWRLLCAVCNVVWWMASQSAAVWAAADPSLYCKANHLRDLRQEQCLVGWDSGILDARCSAWFKGSEVVCKEVSWLFAGSLWIEAF